MFSPNVESFLDALIDGGTTNIVEDTTEEQEVTTPIVIERYDEDVTEPPFTTHVIKRLTYDDDLNDISEMDNNGTAVYRILDNLARVHGYTMKFWSKSKGYYIINVI